VWALKEFGFRAVIAPSFADIFFGNCFKNGVLPITLPAAVVSSLFERVAAGLTLSIDLRTQTITDGDQTYGFEIDPALKEKMLNGMDDIDLTLAEADLIRDFEAGHRQRQPWLFRDS
jgi:3-isopropylmalate/(R)-2-methylmalate dehydratase small subunit